MFVTIPDSFHYPPDNNDQAFYSWFSRTTKHLSRQVVSSNTVHKTFIQVRVVVKPNMLCLICFVILK